MKPIFRTATQLFIAICLFAFKTDNKVMLFNGDNLDNWNIYLQML